MKLNLRNFILLLSVFAISIQLQAQTQSPQKALSFNGVNQAVSGATGISTSLTAITIEAWVYHNTLPASVVQRYVTINPEVAVLRYDGSGGVNKLHFYIKKTNGSLYSLQAENVLTTGTWMHVAGTYDGTTMKLYLNGNLLKSASPAGGLYPPSGSFSFSSTGSEAFNGKMDEVSVWNYARSVSDIREDMYRAAPLADSRLVNYWQFNNGSGTTLSDMKGTATGTLQNTPTWVASTIPFAAVAVNTRIVSTTSGQNFTGTNLSLSLDPISGTDTIVVSRIDTLPNVKPKGVQNVYDKQYWVINTYGTATFNGYLWFKLIESITSEQTYATNKFLLYHRNGNSDSDWSYIASAYYSHTDGTVGFNNITSLGGQYMICNNFPENYPGTTLNLDGTNDYVNCGNASSLNITGSLTIEAWINADTWNANSWGGTIVGKDNTNQTGYDLRCGNNGMLSFVIGVSGGWHEVLSGAVMQTGRWNHVAGVYDGTTMSIYINGILSGQQSLSGSIGVSTQSLLVGNSPGYPTRLFDGKIDEVHIWNVARSQSQIQSNLYNTRTGVESGLVSYWQFNNGSGKTLTDVVGSSTGTLVNIDTTTCWTESYAMVVPAPEAATNILATDFTANWTAPAIGTVTSYKLDVSTNNTFTSLVSGYNNIDCGNNLSKNVTGLNSGTTYYYRVRADKTSLTGTGANHYTYTTVTTCIPPTISSQSTATQTQNLGGTFTAITVTATGNGLSYQWYSNATSDNSGGTSLGSNNGAQTSSYTPQATTGGTLYYYCIVSGTCGTATSAVSGAIIVNMVISGMAGTGTLSDPYQIATLDNLNWLQNLANKLYWYCNFIQTADINAASSENWDSGNGFSPIGRYSIKSFTGTYNGMGHTIDSIYINRTGAGYVGFFGWILNSKIDSLNLTNVSIVSDNGHVGALVGIISSNSTISHCSSSGNLSVSSDYSNIGGLIGTATSISDTIKYCYSTANVNCSGTSNNYIGGFIGKNSGIIAQCYASGLVSGSGTYIGGLAGSSANADQSYWDIETTGQTTGGYNTDTTHVHGRTSAQMKTQSTYIGWDFNNNWYISTNANNGYPCFYYAPELSTQAVTNIQTFTATAHGTIVGKGTLNITSYGVCYNTTGAPTIADNKVNLGAASYFGAFTANMSGLHHSTTYYVRAFAINERDTVYGTQVSFTTTNITQAATCLYNGDEANDISVPNHSSLQLTNNYSIEVWLKPGVAVSTNRIIVSKGYNANGYTLLTNGSGNKRGLIFDGMATADNILTQNQWCHVAAVNDNGTRHLYLDGVEMPLTGTPVSITANTQPLYLTNYFQGDYGVNDLFRGYIEEVRLWNIAMTHSQIRENMHLPLTGSETGLVSYWQFDEGQPPTVYDKKGVNNGTWYYSAINQYKTSTIPFGSGYSNTQVVSTTGTTTFTNTGLAINFTAKTGMDSIVVAKIDTFPNLNPTGLITILDKQYWAVHKYGTGTFTANLTFTISEDLTADDQNNPSKIKLYRRSSMADDSSWVLLTSATSVNATTNTATFNGITGFSQFILARSLCSINVPDANFKAALIALPGLDANNDGEILCSEATAFTGDMDVSNKSIADMTGIEAFTNITKLFCSQNNLTSLNISALTLLTTLACNSNQITTLDVSSNTQLQNLLCGDNLLTSVNTSGLTSLVYFGCVNNDIASLSVALNLGLKGLYCSNNHLTSLNVNGLTSLERIYCDYNQLLNLDFHSNTALKEVTCSHNSQLASLDVKNGNNTNFTSFDAKYNPELYCIQVDNVVYSNTNWTNKDAGASFNTNCNYCLVNIPDNFFKTALLNISGLDADADGEIDCSEAAAYTGDIDVANKNISNIIGIEAFTSITHLDCHNNYISTLDVSNNTLLTYLDCSENGTNALDVTADTALTYLNCSTNQIPTLDISANTALTYLNCSANQISALDATANTALMNLYCNDNLLLSLNVKNGNNAIITAFNATNNPNLTCIQVDDAAYSTANWLQKDTWASFSTNCGAGHTLSGKTRYASRANTGNPAPNPPTYNAVMYTIDHVIVILKSNPAGTELARDTSDALGAYQFNNVADGNYILSYDKYTIDSMQWGNDVNAIDLALIKYYVGADTLVDPSRNFYPKYRKAANVDNNLAINAVDISRVKAKIGSPFNPSKNFPKGNWVALDTSVTVAGANVNITLKTICYGDFNASSSKYRDSVATWSSAKSLPVNIINRSDESITINSYDYFEVPLRISRKVNDFSALGLELNYPGKDFKLVNVAMPKAGNKNSTVKFNQTLDEIIADNNDLLVTDDDGVIRVVYATTNHFDVETNDEMITLGFRSINDLSRGQVEFTLSGPGVIGDMYGNENEEAYLIMPKIFVQGNHTEAGFEFAGYPNPFRDEATITYNIPENGTVTLNLYNAIGEMVSELVNETQGSGKHLFVYSSKKLPAGMYTFKLEFTGMNKSKCLMLKMIH